MPAFSFARLQEDLAGGKLTADAAADYMAVFSAFGTGQLRHLSGRLGLPDPADRQAALDTLEGRLAACMTGAFPVAAGGPTTDTDGATATAGEKEAAKGKEGVKAAAPAPADAEEEDAAKDAAEKGETPADCPGCPPPKPEKGGKAGQSPGSAPPAPPPTSYASPGAADGSEGMKLWKGEGGASPGKGGKTSYASPGAADGSEGMKLWTNEGGASPGKGGKMADPPADPSKVALAPVAQDAPPCPGCPKGVAAEMGLDVGGDGDDDSGPLTAEHVLAEAGANGITDRDAAYRLAAFVQKNPGTTHAQVHSLYDLVRAFTAGGAMKQPAAVDKAVTLGSLDGLKRAAANGDGEARAVVARMPAEFSADYWGGVVLSAGRPRTRVAVFAEFAAAGVPVAYTQAYLADAAPYDPAGEWLALPGAAGAVRVCVGFDGTITGGPAGLFGRPVATALHPAHHAVAFAAQARATAAARTVAFEQARAADGKFGSGGGDGQIDPSLEASAKEAEKNYVPPKGGDKPIDKSGDKSNSLLGRLFQKMKGGKAGVEAAPATTGLFAALQSLSTQAKVRGGAVARFAATAAGATPAGLDPQYYWDELVAGPHGRTTRLAALATALDAGFSEAGAVEAAGRAEFVVKHLATAAKVVGKAAVGTAKAAGKVAGAIDKKLDKIGGGGDHGHGGGGHGGGGHGGGGGDHDDGHWITISGPQGTTHIQINEEGHITKGPAGLVNRPAKEALSDHHHEMVEGAKAKAREKREAREKGGHGDGHGDGHGKGASHGDTTHAAHAAAHKVSSTAEHIETAIHFLLHPGAAAAAVAASKVLGGRVGGVKKRIHGIETKIRERYGHKTGTAIICAGIAGSFAGGMALPGIGHVLVPATPGMHLVAALPIMAAAETLMAGGKAVKLGGRALAAGLDKMKGAAGLLRNFVTGGGKKAAPAAPAQDGPKSKRQQRMLDKANAKKAKSQGVSPQAAEMTADDMAAVFAFSDLLWAAWPGEAALFSGDRDPNDEHLDISNAEIQREGKKFWDELMAGYLKDLRAHSGDLKILNDAIESGRKAGTKDAADAPKLKKKKKKKPFPPQGGDAGGDTDGGDSAPPFVKKKKKKEKGNPFAKGDVPFSRPAQFTQASLFDDEPLEAGPMPTEAPTVTPTQTPTADLHKKAAKLAKRLSREARSGRAGVDSLRAGIGRLKKFKTPHLETAARCLGLGGPLGGKAGTKSAALKRIASHLKTHAKAAAAELHAAAGLPAEPVPTVVVFDGKPRTRGWVAASLVAAGHSPDEAAARATHAAAFTLDV